MTSCGRPDCPGIRETSCQTCGRRPCNRPGCPGFYLDIGFCDTCKRRPLAQPAPRHPPPLSLRESSTTHTPSSGSWVARDLVSLPVLELKDPSSLVLTGEKLEEKLKEDSRSCSNTKCSKPVGRGYRGQPGLTDGFCENCGTRFSFSLKLAAGDLVDEGRYRIDGPIARGGFGWVYLARDLRLDQPVVLKGLINTEDQQARELAANERVALRTLDHPNLVRIYDFVHHPDPATSEPIDYIVMEYVGGPALSELKVGSPWRAEHGPMTPEHVITYVLEILGALDYLHGIGLLYCDMKPDNAIRSANRLKVIDLGAVQAIDGMKGDSIGTEGYRVSAEEFAEHGLTVRSDLHTVGKTLQVLSQVTEDACTDKVRPGRISLGLRSLRHVHERARDNYHRRFGTAAEMAEQLTGVLREIVALRDGVRRPRPSTVFQESAILLDAGLGTVPSLSRWTTMPPNPKGDDSGVLADGRPSPRTVALGLPVPSVRADDRGADYLATLTVTEPQAMTELLRKPSTPSSIEIHLLACRALIELEDLHGADNRLAAASRLLRYPDHADWRFAWHRGLLELAKSDVETAKEQFVAVYRDLPGEDAPKMALGFCAEHGGELSEAEQFYEAVWVRERLQASAAFGLARIRLMLQGRDAAVAVLDQVGENSRHFEAARIAAITVLCGGLAPGAATGDGLPRSTDLNAAVDRLNKLTSLDRGERDGPGRALMTTVLRAAALSLTGTLTSVRGGDVLGQAPSERTLRTLLERSFRRLAEQADNGQDHGVLVDHANAVRPNTLW